jgi:hypothetical protein
MAALQEKVGSSCEDSITTVLWLREERWTHIKPSEHEGVRRILPLGAGTARLIAEGRTASDPGYLFQRWRLNDR